MYHFKFSLQISQYISVPHLDILSLPDKQFSKAKLNDDIHMVDLGNGSIISLFDFFLYNKYAI
jgi:hypothetical protein